MHSAKPILDKFYGYMDSICSTNGYESLRGVLEVPRSYPAIMISMGNDSSERFNLKTLKQSISFYIDIFNNSTTADLDTDILVVRENIFNAVMANPKHDLDYVITTNFIGQDAPNYAGEGQNYAASTRLEFVVQYLTENNTQTI